MVNSRVESTAECVVYDKINHANDASEMMVNFGIESIVESVVYGKSEILNE